MVGNFQGIGKIPELRKRLLVTFLLLGVYRIGSHVPVPGIDASAMAEFFNLDTAELMQHPPVS